MRRKVKLILNPMADLGRAWKIADDLRPIAQEFRGELSWSGTVYPTHAMELAKQAAEEGCELVIALGGDGTVHEVVNGLMQVPEEKRPALGVVPVGSGNDFAYSMGIPTQSAQALLRALHSESIETVDVGLITDENGRQEYFDNTLGMGFDTVVTIRSHKLPIVKGFMMYLTAVLQTIVLNHHAAQMQIEAEDKQWEERLLMLTILNGPREGGGFYLSPQSNNKDGILEYLTVRQISRGMMLRLLPEFLKGTHIRFNQVQLGACRRIQVTSDQPLYIHTDGEIFTSFGSSVRKATIEVAPQALRVVK